MNVPRKWWWTAAIAVPIVVALIGVAPKLLGTGGGNPNVVYTSVGRDQIQGDVAINPITFIQQEVRADGEPLPENVVALLEGAMRALEEQAPDKALPLFQAAAEAAPTPAVLNNLGAAYLAAGEPDKAREILLEAKAKERRPEETAALEHNLRQVAQASQPSSGGPVQPTRWPGVTAQLTRFDDAGGLVTVEVTYQNTGAATADVCIRPYDNYLVDEATGRRWDQQHSGGTLCGVGGGPLPLEPGATRVTWAKFLVEPPRPARFSAVASGAVRPFEGLALGAD